MSGAPGPGTRPGLLDAALFPDRLGPETAPTGAAAAGGPTGDAAADGPRWWRAVGAFVFWNLAQALFLLPRLDGGAGPGMNAPVTAWYRPLIPPAIGAAINVAVALGFLWWFVWRPAARGDARRRETFRLRALPRPAWRWAGAAAVSAAVAVNAGLLVLPRVARLPKQEPLIEFYTRLPGGSLALAALAVLVAPLLEEFFFRGWAQGALERRMPAWPAILVTAGTFAALHGLDAFGLVPRAALATAAGYAVWATQSIWPGVALHAAYNASLFVGGAALPALLPAPPRTEAWADTERAAFFFWAHDPRVFWPALVVLVVAVAATVAALARLAGTARPPAATPTDASPVR